MNKSTIVVAGIFFFLGIFVIGPYVIGYFDKTFQPNTLTQLLQTGINKAVQGAKDLWKANPLGLITIIGSVGTGIFTVASALYNKAKQNITDKATTTIQTAETKVAEANTATDQALTEVDKYKELYDAEIAKLGPLKDTIEQQKLTIETLTNRVENLIRENGDLVGQIKGITTQVKYVEKLT